MITLRDIMEAKKNEARIKVSPVSSEARPFAEALRAGQPPRFIAEFKRASPSAGPIRPGADPAELARAYEGAGARALSVLTDRRFFDGSPDHLGRAREATSLPVLRKDFLLDPEEVVISRQMGADAVLLIVAALERTALRESLAAAREVGIAALVEVHDERECEQALEESALIVGINHRDLRTMEVDLSVSERLRPRIPADVVVVGESGIRRPSDVRRLIDLGVDALLVGESLMKAKDPAEALRALSSIPGAGKPDSP